METMKKPRFEIYVLKLVVGSGSKRAGGLTFAARIDAQI